MLSPLHMSMLASSSINALIAKTEQFAAQGAVSLLLERSEAQAAALFVLSDLCHL